MKVIFVAAIFVLIFNVSARGKTFFADTTNEQRNRRNFTTPVYGLDFYHFKFDKFGVKFPVNANFTSFSNSSRRTGISFYLGFYRNNLGIIGYADLNSLLRRENAEKELWTNKYLKNVDSLSTNKVNYYHQWYGFDFLYEIKVSKHFKLIPILGWQHWSFISEFEVVSITDGKLTRNYSARKNFNSMTIGMKPFLFTLWGDKKSLPSSANDSKLHYYQWGGYFEPSFKKFFDNNVSLLNFELGIGPFVELPYNNTPGGLIYYFSAGIYKGDIKTKMYHLGVKMR